MFRIYSINKLFILFSNSTRIISFFHLHNSVPILYPPPSPSHSLTNFQFFNPFPIPFPIGIKAQTGGMSSSRDKDRSKGAAVKLAAVTAAVTQQVGLEEERRG